MFKDLFLSDEETDESFHDVRTDELRKFEEEWAPGRPQVDALMEQLGADKELAKGCAKETTMAAESELDAVLRDVKSSSDERTSKRNRASQRRGGRHRRA